MGIPNAAGIGYIGSEGRCLVLFFLQEPGEMDAIRGTFVDGRRVENWASS
jgi:hypothetical protein